MTYYYNIIMQTSQNARKFKVVNIIFKKMKDTSVFDENIIHIILNYYWKLFDKKKYY
jgi:hypothetical protein